MKKILNLVFAITLLVNTHLTLAENLKPFNFDYSNNPVSLVDFISSIYKDIYKENYRFDSSFLSIQEKLKFNLSNLDKNDLDVFVKDLSKQYSFKMEKLGNITVFSKVGFNNNDSLPFDITKLPSQQINTNFSQNIEPIGLITKPDAIDIKINDLIIDPSNIDKINTDYKRIVYYNCLSDCSKFVEPLKMFNYVQVQQIKSKLVLFFNPPDDLELVDYVNKVTTFLNLTDLPDKNYSVKSFVYEVGVSKTDYSAFKIVAELFNKNFKVQLNDISSSSILTLNIPDFTVFFTQLNNDSRFSLLSSPSGVVKLNEPFHLSVGTSVPTLDQVVVNNGTSSQSVVYRDSGVIFDITPTFDSDKNITLSIFNQISSFSGVSAGSVTAPSLNKREFKTTASLPYGKVLVLGGLKETKQDNSKGGFFGLNLNKNKSYSESELLIFVYLEPEKIKVTL